MKGAPKSSLQCFKYSCKTQLALLIHAERLPLNPESAPTRCFSLLLLVLGPCSIKDYRG